MSNVSLVLRQGPTIPVPDDTTVPVGDVIRYPPPTRVASGSSTPATTCCAPTVGTSRGCST